MMTQKYRWLYSCGISKQQVKMIEKLVLRSSDQVKTSDPFQHKTETANHYKLS